MATSHSKADDGDVADLALAVDAFAAAWASGDMLALQSLLSPSYTHNDAFGQHHTRDGWLAYAAERKGRATRIATRGLTLRIIGDVGIVTGFNDISGAGVRSADDKSGLTLVFLQVWRKTDGRWLREAFQATPVRFDAAPFS